MDKDVVRLRDIVYVYVIALSECSYRGCCCECVGAQKYRAMSIESSTTAERPYNKHFYNVNTLQDLSVRSDSTTSSLGEDEATDQAQPRKRGREYWFSFVVRCHFIAAYLIAHSDIDVVMFESCG